MAVLIAEQKVRDVLGICSRAYSLKLGAVAYAGGAAELKDDPVRLKKLFLRPPEAVPLLDALAVDRNRL